MNPKYLHTLELDKILARLASHTAFAASEQLARALTPSVDAAEIARWQTETTEARALLDEHPETGIGGARDVRPLTRHARIGAALTPPEFLDIRATIHAARTLRRTLTKLDALYPRLAARARELQELEELTAAITRAINDRGEVADNASPELTRIRSELNATRNRLMDKLQRLLASNAKVVQEAIITQRDGRYVIPIRAEAKGRLPGIVHDTSSSGATLFIEPLAVVEQGNRVRELERAETREVERILRALTDRVAAHADALDANVETLAELDVALAKAKYAVEIKAVEPRLEVGNWKLEVGDAVRASNPQSPTSNFYLDLRDARHPLLDPETVVPISIALGKEPALSGAEGFSILILTGPNTGGKTVTLKTIGLLALMAQCGMHVPAKSARLPIFDGIYADIGDEQSIEQSLSTFSSHLNNIVEILREADARSLVLFDELGAGTDPIEGSALARAILQHLLDRRIPALVATHYAELKAFAQTTPGVQNASMEFDVETLSPTFHLTIGLPGQSNAFAIASRLGLDSAIIEQARGALAHSDVEMEKLLAEIKRARAEASAQQAQAEMARREAEKLSAETRRESAEIEDKRAEILEGAQNAARAELEQMRAELKRLREEWRAVSLTREYVEGQKEKLEEIAERFTPTLSSPVSNGGGEGVGVGDYVLVARLAQRGQVIALDEDSADVQVGNIRVRVALNEIEKIAAEEKPRARDQSEVIAPSVESPGVEVSLRGMRADDALHTLEQYLDRAYLTGLPYVRIVHGKGTGTLRKLARDLLRDHPLVAEIREAAPYEGGEGVTIAKLVAR